MDFRLKHWGLFLLASIVLVPVLIYIAGGILVGPYEGASGLFGLIKSIYGDALTGDLSTWFLLASPVLLVLIWVACVWMHSNINNWIAGKT